MSQVRLVNKFGFKGLKVKTKDADRDKKQDFEKTKQPDTDLGIPVDEVSEEITATKKIVDDNQVVPEILIIGKKTTFRSKIFVYSEGEIVCDKPIPSELIFEKGLQMAVIRESPKTKKQTLIVHGVVADWKPPVRKIKLDPMEPKVYAQFLEFFK